VHDRQLGAHAHGDALQPLAPDARHDGLPQSHQLDRDAPVPARQQLVDHEVGALELAAGLVAGHAGDEPELELEPACAQPLDGLDERGRPLQGRVAGRVHDDGCRARLDLDGLPRGEVDARVREEARIRAQVVEQVGVERVDPVRPAGERGRGARLARVRRHLRRRAHEPAQRACRPDVVALVGDEDRLAGPFQPRDVAQLDRPRVEVEEPVPRARLRARQQRGAEVEVDDVGLAQRLPQRPPAGDLAPQAAAPAEHLVDLVAVRRRVDGDGAAVDAERPLGARERGRMPADGGRDVEHAERGGSGHGA
jgi:hypothetical protein